MTRALVTGASAGIGAAFARRLAGDGYELVLVARTRSRLEQAVPDLRHRGSPHIEVLPADLADAAERARVVARLTGSNRPIDLLVNNAGMALGKGLLDATEEELAAQLELNVHAVMLLSHAALPGMIKRRHGGVVNIASVAGLTPGRGSTYSASKAWVISFSEGMAMALRGTGVRMVVVCPGFVHTDFHRRVGIDQSGTPEMLWVDIDTVIDESLAGLRANRPIVVPGTVYKGVARAIKLLPRSVIRGVANRVDRGPRD